MKKNSAIFLGITGLLLCDSMAYAATKKIASQDYVDSREAEILNMVSTTYETRENVADLSDKVTQLDDTISAPDTGLNAKIDKVSGDLSTTQETVATISGNLVNKEDVGNKATSITVENQASPTAYPSVSAIVQWTNDKILELSEEGLPVSPDNIGAGSITEDKLDVAVVNKIDGKEDKTNKVITLRDSAAATDTAYPSEKAVATALEGKADIADLDSYATTDSLATVATTGSYNDLIDAPDIPEAVVVDETITAQGTNPVQGKAVYEALAGKQPVGDYATNTELSAAVNELNTGVTELETEVTNKQNANMGAEAANKIVTTDGTGNITTSDTIANTQVSGLGALATKSTVTGTDIAADAAIAKTQLATNVQTSLGLADTSVQPDAINDMLTKAEASTTYETISKAAATYIPKPGTNCTEAGAKCVLVTNGTEFAWEDIARGASEGAQP